jgi:hypothetical protein
MLTDCHVVGVSAETRTLSAETKIESSDYRTPSARSGSQISWHQTDPWDNLPRPAPSLRAAVVTLPAAYKSGTIAA